MGGWILINGKIYTHLKESISLSNNMKQLCSKLITHIYMCQFIKKK